MPDNWPKHPNGKNKKIGEMTREERRAVTKEAVEKIGPEVSRAVQIVEARETMVAVRRAVGFRYKSLIRSAWADGNYAKSGLSDFATKLQWIRNTLGPEWLANYTPDADQQ